MASLVQILIKAKDEASKEINKVKGSLDGLGSEGGKSTEGLGLDFDSMVGAITTGTAIAAAAITAFKVTLDFAQEGAEIQRLQDTSAMLARSMGFDMDEIVAAVSEASLGTVSDLDIMSSASKAMMLGVGSSAEEMASLMEVAAIRGRALGLDATEAFDQIVRGIGRLSPKILDNLGIIVDADATYAAYAESIGKAASDLTEVEKRQALVNAVIADTAPLLAEAGGLTKDSASAWEEMSAAQKNYWDKMKSNASDLMVWWPEFWAAFYRAMTPTDLSRFPEFLSTLSNALNEGAVEIDDYNQILRDVKNGFISIPDGIREVNTALAEHRAASIASSEANQDSLIALFNSTNSWEEFQVAAQNAGLDLVMLTEEIYNSAKADVVLAEETQAAAVEAMLASGDYEGLAAAIGVTTDEAKAMTKAWQESEEAHAKMMAELESITTLDRNYKGIIDLGYEYTDILEDITEQETIMANNPIGSEKYEEAKGKVEALKGTMTDLANQVTLDMFQATIAVGGVTEAELAAYMQMAIDMGYMSEEGAKAAIAAYGNAIETINGYAIDDKTGNVSIDAVAAFLTLDLLQAYALKDKEAKAIFKVQWEYGTPPGEDYDQYDIGGYPANGQAIHAATGVAASLPHYWVGELGPEPFFPAQNGRIVSNTQALAALRGGAGVNGAEIADAVKRGLVEALRGNKDGIGNTYEYNLTMPTSQSAADVAMAFDLLRAYGDNA